MEYFAGLDISMAETHVCVMTENGVVIHNAKVPSTPADIAAELIQLGLPVICIESRQK
jgi:transposase